MRGYVEEEEEEEQPQQQQAERREMQSNSISHLTYQTDSISRHRMFIAHR